MAIFELLANRQKQKHVIGPRGIVLDSRCEAKKRLRQGAGASHGSGLEENRHEDEC
jgi:hypothetical protein